MLLPLLLATFALAGTPAPTSDARSAGAAPPAALASPSVDEPLVTGLKNSVDSALVVANEVHAELPPQVFATRDAEAFTEFLRDTLGISSSRIRALNGADAGAMRAGLKKAASKVGKGGTLWVYFAGHGTVDAQGERILLGVDQPSKADRAGKAGVPLDEVIDAATRAGAKRAIVILDAGFGTRGRGGTPLFAGRAVPVPRLQPPESPKIVLWTATSTSETPEVWEETRHGLFTWLVLGALRGWADGALGDLPDGIVTVGEAQEYVTDLTARLGRLPRPTVASQQEIWGQVLMEGNLEIGPSPEHVRALAARDRSDRAERLGRAKAEEASAAWEDVRVRAAKGTPEGKAALEDFVSTWERPTMMLDWSPYVPEVREARRLLTAWGKPEAMAALLGTAKAPAASGAGKASPAPTSGKAGEPVGAARAYADLPTDTCDDLVKFEDLARAGQLKEGHISCLEGRLSDPGSKMTTREKISRVLLVDAEARKDYPRWESLIARHMKDIDQSDPDLAFKYAVYLSKKSGGDREQVIWWSSRALDRKDAWSGTLYEKKVFALHRIRAEAAVQLWSSAEKAYLKARSPQAEDAAERARGIAKEYARAWLEYARVSEQDAKTALQLCLQAAGAEEYCKEE
ncbi:MAG: caspase family protein [Deltaproteobacteria bacterium]|nr:caspase family protein [Deltaproteobacteria bacterium]